MAVNENIAKASLSRPSLPDGPGDRRRWGRLYGSARSLITARAAARARGPLLLICESVQEAEALTDEVRFFARAEDLTVSIFPDWETLPYDVFSPHQDIISDRLATLATLPDMERGVVITAAQTLMQRLPPVSYVSGGALMLDTGQRLDIDQLRLRLETAGYRAVSQVMEHGEFAVRGSLVDVFPMGSRQPFRIDLFDDEIESLRAFDPDTQLTTEKLEQIRMLPAREFPLGEEAIRQFRQRYRQQFEGDPQQSEIYRAISDGNQPGGIEYYLPLFFDETASLFDYLPDVATVAMTDGAFPALERQWQEIQERYQQRGHDRERPLLEPARIALVPEAVQAALERHGQVYLERPEGAHDPEALPVDNFATRAPPRLPLDHRAEDPARALSEFLDDFDGAILITAESPGRREALIDMLSERQRKPVQVGDWQGFLKQTPPLAICVAELTEGLILPDEGLAVIAEPQLFGERAQQRRRRRAVKDPETIVRDLTDLSEGAPVIHEEHGVGRYLGLQTLDMGDEPTEFLTLEYAGGDKLYVPVASLNLISRYTGTSPENAPLHRLGSDQWDKARKRAARKARDVAAELLDLYARRSARQGTAFKVEEKERRAFEEDFPFEETPDQATAIQAVVDDLKSTQPMDRVVCGDVGFGKTEVALRAAFVAVQAGKQVAVLVPTTLLGRQHLDTFKDRFADWPIKIASLSRMGSGKDKTTTLEGLAEGTVDIVIGTHKLLSRDVKFKDLGLVIIDEEHRFGVRHKEQLKQLRAEVDVLTLTATPIPRTLNMSLAGIRDLSIIATPPAERLSVKTFVNEWSDGLIREACLREIRRGGQVYFLHNEVRTIDRTASRLRELLPEAQVEVAHGKMRESEMERVMLDFYHRRANILVCSTIVESGIDVPTANTIIINRADKFGLAQLHQLRGRVGRSHHRAYAYLLTPPRNAMTADAVKRLEAIESLEDLGAGFTLSTHDLEIRGAGELLGDEQSGQIHEVGFSLYTELLERAVKSLKAGEEPELDKPLNHGPEVELGVPALLPEDYVPDVHTRLTLYKRIASAKDSETLRELQVEMIDRFGLLPDYAKNLFLTAEVRLLAQPLGIRRVEMGPEGGRLDFEEEPDINPVALIDLVQSKPNRFKLDGQTRLRFHEELPERDDRVSYLRDILARLKPDDEQRKAG
ncbi:transcription-repair coupling factor (superfamily II helicase) [Natronospira proteinivora]|uniref:Transcription-repair-coupling factor n=1 Tax=Natronospira proteinivora TaxID=1807133 RepID=A0ABT1G5W7_9GAMM|nr:transcription-repair coupling factor [Natronospira proteinivora]MCP1726694.1 transcription-repair coupling factor (superfamily II helicase) [Natronospira proteinivora]